MDNTKLDKIGIFLAGLCCIHCLATPILLMAAPWLGEIFESYLFHVIMLVTIAPVAFISLRNHSKVHGDKLPVKLAVVGIALLALGIIVPEFFEHGHGGEHLHIGLGGTLEKAFSVVGGLLVAISHILNIKSCRCSHHSH